MSGFQEGDFDVKIEGMQEEEIDALLKKYKKLNKYRKSNLFAVKMMDGTEDIISSLLEDETFSQSNEKETYKKIGKGILNVAANIVGG